MFSALSLTSRNLRRLGLLATVLAVGSSAACSSSGSGGGGGAGGGSASSASHSNLNIQFVSPLPSYPTFKTLAGCMQKEASARGANVTVSGPTGQAPDPTTMVTQIQQAITSKRGAIVTVPLSEGFTPVLQQAQKKGILTATFLGPGGANSGSDINLNYDYTAIGKEYVGAIAKLSGQHNLGLVAAANVGVGKQWLDGVTAAAAATSNVKIVGTVYTGDDATKALPQVNALLAAHPEVNLIATNMGTVTPGAVAAIKAKNLTGKVGLLVAGSDNGGSAALKAGTAKLMFVQDVCGAGKNAVDGLVALHNKKTAPTAVYGTDVIDQAQLQAYLDKGWS